MNVRVMTGSLLTYMYNAYVGRVPSRLLRMIYLRSYLGSLGAKTGVQLRCRFLNARKVYLGDRNVINFGCLLDGRKFKIVTGSDVSMGPDATI